MVKTSHTTGFVVASFVYGVGFVNGWLVAAGGVWRIVTLSVFGTSVVLIGLACWLDAQRESR